MLDQSNGFGTSKRGAFLAFVLGIVVAGGSAFAWREVTSSQFTLPSAAGQTITPGGPARGDATADWQPPPAYQRNTFLGVQFGSGQIIRANCGRTSNGRWAAACERQDGSRIPVIIAPNPCGLVEAYALMLCHEIGHAEGWETWHVGGHFVGYAHAYAVRLEGLDRSGRKLEWATAIEASSKSEAEAKARVKVRRLIPWFRAHRVDAFGS